MSSPTKPVEDNVSKVNDDLAVGSDLEFQRRWWRFERIIWAAFLLLIIADVLGFLGRGYFAKGQVEASDGSIIQYERIERSATPSILSIRFSADAIRDGKVHLWADDSLLKGLGAQRVIPQPESSVIGMVGFYILLRPVAFRQPSSFSSNHRLRDCTICASETHLGRRLCYAVTRHQRCKPSYER